MVFMINPFTNTCTCSFKFRAFFYKFAAVVNRKEDWIFPQHFASVIIILLTISIRCLRISFGRSNLWYFTNACECSTNFIFAYLTCQRRCYLLYIVNTYLCTVYIIISINCHTTHCLLLACRFMS